MPAVPAVAPAHSRVLVRAPRKQHHPLLTSRLPNFRYDRRESLEVFAKGAGISIPRLRDAECHGLATADTLSRLAAYLGVKVSALVGAKVPA